MVHVILKKHLLASCQYLQFEARHVEEPWCRCVDVDTASNYNRACNVTAQVVCLWRVLCDRARPRVLDVAQSLEK